MLSLVVLALALCCACVTQDTGSPATTAPADNVTPGVTATTAENVPVKVFHAGSLTGPFEKLKARFEVKYPNAEVLLEPGGSVDIIKRVTDLNKSADVIASADYALIPQYMVPSAADWYLTFAKNQMTLAYTNKSAHASEITADNWYTILARDDVRWAFSDPNADPCGYRTPITIYLAEDRYKDDTLFETLVEKHSNISATKSGGVWTIDATDPGPDGTKLTIRPKNVELVQMLQAGGIDYAWEYRSVSVQNDLEYIELSDEIDLSSIDFNDTYATVKTRAVKGNETTLYPGSPIVYGVTVPKNAEHPDCGTHFVETLISDEGQAILTADGQPPIAPAAGSGTSRPSSPAWSS